jgi:hypothetical protein
MLDVHIQNQHNHSQAHSVHHLPATALAIIALCMITQLSYSSLMLSPLRCLCSFVLDRGLPGLGGGLFRFPLSTPRAIAVLVGERGRLCSS